MAKRRSIERYRPRGRGVAKLLGGLETRVMERVWKAGSATVREVHEALARDGRGEWAYTTVMTVMSRLAEKGVLERCREGSAYRYRPALEREAFIADASRDVFSGLVRDLQGPIAAAFVDGLDKTEVKALERLARLIEERRTGRRR